MWAEHVDRVQPEWLDGNGHMNLAYYVLVFDRGTDAWLELAGLGAAYRRTGRSVFAAETHTIYRREVDRDAELVVRTRLAAASGKRIHLLHEMQSDNMVVAMQEALFLHVDLGTRRSVPLGEPEAARVVGLLPIGTLAPAWMGRRVGQDARPAVETGLTSSP